MDKSTIETASSDLLANASTVSGIGDEEEEEEIIWVEEEVTEEEEVEEEETEDGSVLIKREVTAVEEKATTTTSADKKEQEDDTKMEKKEKEKTKEEAEVSNGEWQEVPLTIFPVETTTTTAEVAATTTTTMAGATIGKTELSEGNAIVVDGSKEIEIEQKPVSVAEEKIGIEKKNLEEMPIEMAASETAKNDTTEKNEAEKMAENPQVETAANHHQEGDDAEVRKVMEQDGGLGKKEVEYDQMAQTLAEENGEEDVQKEMIVPIDEAAAPAAEMKQQEAKEVDQSRERQPQGDEDKAEASSAVPSTKGVRFVDATTTNKREAKVEEVEEEDYEQKLRLKTREALQLVDRICGLQAPEGEKRPPIQRPQLQFDDTTPPTTTALPAASSTIVVADNECRRRGSQEEQPLSDLKAALAAGVHGLAGGAKGNGGGMMETAAAASATTQQPFIEIGEGPVLDVDSVSVNAGILSSPTDCVLLPGQLLLIVDSVAGLTLISLETKQILQRLAPQANVWRNAECACVGGGEEGTTNGTTEQQHVYILLEYNMNNQNGMEEQQRKDEVLKEEAETAKTETTVAGGTPIGNVDSDEPNEQKQQQQTAQQTDEEQSTQQQQTDVPANQLIRSTTRRHGILKNNNDNTTAKNNGGGDGPRWERFICRFAIPDFRMLDRVEAPKWLRERVVWQCHLCFVPQTGCLYLAANTPNQGFLFELHSANNNRQARWTECVGTRRHSQFADLHLFAVVGPVTELLLVETNRCYVQLLSVYNSTVVSARTLGCCERPGALCVDDQGNVLIHDRAASSVGLFARAFLEKVGDLALIERANCRLSARQGVLAVLCRPIPELKLHRYGQRLARIERMLMGGDDNEEQQKPQLAGQEQEEKEEAVGKQRKRSSNNDDGIRTTEAS